MRKLKVMVLFIAGLSLAGCDNGSDKGDFGTSRLGETCGKRSDCIEGLTCVGEKCVVDETTDRSCDEIEALFAQSVLAEDADNCAKNTDCLIVKGLCNASDDRASASSFVNNSIEEGLSALSDEWDANGCDENTACSSSGMASAWCMDGACGDGGFCYLNVDDICTAATRSGCDVFENSSQCKDGILDQLECDPDGGDQNQVSDCLYDAELNCDSADAFLSSALSSCGDVLGLAKKD